MFSPVTKSSFSKYYLLFVSITKILIDVQPWGHNRRLFTKGCWKYNTFVILKKTMLTI